MIKRSRPSARRFALFAVILGVAGGIALGVVSCVGGVDDADKYGRVSMPGKGRLDLPEGDVHLYYEERVTLQNDRTLDVPSGIQVVARREETVRSKRTTENAITLDGRALTEFGKLEIPRAGEYRVTVRARDRGSNQPAVTFGKGQFENFTTAGRKAVLVMAGGGLVALLALLLGRRGYRPPTPYELAAQRPAWPSAPVVPPAPAPVPATPPAAAGGDPLAAQLAEIDRLHAAGHLTDEQHQQRRRAAIDGAFGRPGG